MEIILEQLLQRSASGLLRELLSAWFSLGCLQPMRQRVHARAVQALEMDAQILTDLATQYPFTDEIEIESPKVAPMASMSWTPLRSAPRRCYNLAEFGVKSRDFWAQRAMLQAWRLQSARDRLFNAMPDLELEDGDIFLDSPDRPRRSGGLQWSEDALVASGRQEKGW